MAVDPTIDPSLFAITAELRAAHATFARELAAVPADRFRPYFDRASYEGGWFVFPFVFDVDPLPDGYDVMANRELCPESWRTVSSWPRISLAAFSRMMPGCVVPAHHDAPRQHVLRFHLGLDGIEQGILVFAAGTYTLRPGEVRVIDHSLEHGAANRGSAPRTLFALDYRLDAKEVAAVERARGAVHKGCTDQQRTRDVRR